MGISGHAAWVGTALFALPVWIGTSVTLAARFLRNPVRFCRHVDRSKSVFPDPVPGLQHRYYEVGDGVKLHAATHGLGTGRPLLLLLHGFPEMWHSWHNQISAFLDEYEVVALDMRGYGGSDAPAGLKKYHMSRLCSDLVAVISATGHSSCKLVAHDWGGAVAWCFAANHPHMVERLSILCSPHPAAYKDPRRFTSEQMRRSWYFLLFMARCLPETWLRNRDFEKVEQLMMRVPMGVRTPGAISREDMERYKAALSRKGALSAAINYYRASIDNQTAHPSKELQRAIETRLMMPVVLLYAEQDAAFSPSMFTGMEAHAESITVVPIPECSHWAQLDRPDLVNSQLKSFLAGGKRARPGTPVTPLAAITLTATTRLGTAPAGQGRGPSRQGTPSPVRHGSALAALPFNTVAGVK